MKKLMFCLCMSLMAFGTNLHADYNQCDPCCNYECDPCAPACGTDCGTNWCCTGIAVVLIAGFIAAVATNSDSASSHSGG